MHEVDLAADDALARPKSSRADAWAWGVCWLMFASTVLNYMDRQAMALVAPYVKAEYRLGEADFGWLLSAFYVSYALFQVPAGYFVDRLNVRWSYAGAVGWWSLAAVASSFSPTLGILMVFRALLGVGESFNWPCALRATAIILRPADRTLGNGIFNSGAAVGAVLTPLVVTPLAAYFGWRTAFAVVGTLGFVWVLIWLSRIRGERGAWFAGRSSIRAPAESGTAAARRLSNRASVAFGLVAVMAVLVALMAAGRVRAQVVAPFSELAPRFVTAILAMRGEALISWAIAWLMIGLLLVARVLPTRDLQGPDWTESLGEIVRIRRFWVLVVVSISINVCWHFLLNWIPTYLEKDRGMTIVKGGLLSAIPFLAADAGNLGGGALSRWFAQRGLPAFKARMLVILGCTLTIFAGSWVAKVPSDRVVMIMLGLMAMGTAAFMANYFAFSQEVSTRHTGLVVGILGGLGNLAAAGFHPFAGYVKDVSNSFGLVFLIAGLLPFVGLLTLVLGWGWSEEEGKPT